MRATVATFWALTLVITSSCGTAARSAAGVTAESRAIVDTFFDKFGRQWAIDTTPDGRFVTSLTGAPSGTAFVGREGRELVALLVLLGGSDPTLATATAPVESRVGPVVQYTYQQSLGGVPIENAFIRIQRSEEGGPVDILVNTAHAVKHPTLLRGPEWAHELVKGSVTEELRSPSKRLSEVLPDPKDGARTWSADHDDVNGVTTIEVGYPAATELLAVARQVRTVYKVPARVRVQTPDGFRDVILREYFVDADAAFDGDPILRVTNFIMPLVTGKARVFNPNPVNSLHPQCVTHPVVNREPPYFERQLYDLNESADGAYKLRGLHVAIEDSPTVQGSPDFSTTRENSPHQFAAANAYYHIDSMARWLIDIGFPDLVRPMLSVDVDAGVSSGPKGAFVDANSFTGPHIWLTQNDNGMIYVAEDGDALAHEYAHALLQTKTAGRFILDKPKKGKNEARAINEGFADYWAVSTFVEENARTKHPLDCLEEWANSGKCLRCYPAKSHKKFDDTTYDHENGQIWSGTLFRILGVLGTERRLADVVILEGQLLRAFKGDGPTMKEMAEGIAIVASQKADAAQKKAICELFKKHDIGPVICCKEIACSAKWLPP